MSIVEFTQRKLYDLDENAWREQLKQLVTNEILALSTKDPQVLAKLTDDETMQKVWIPVFTDRTYDQKHNYQIYEKLGDNVMETLYSNKLILAVPDLDEQRLTEMINKYLSAKPQAQYINDRKWLQFFRTKFVTNLKTAEDLLEAIFGGIYYAGNMNLGQGYGDILASGLMNSFFRNVDLSLDVTKANKTIIKETLERVFKKGAELDLTVNEINDGAGNTTYDAVLKLPTQIKGTPINVRADFNSIIQQHNNQNPNNPLPLFGEVLAKTSGTSFKDVETKVYEMAVKEFESRGITPDWARTIRMRKNVVNLADPDVFFKAFEKARGQGFINLDYGKAESKAPYVYQTLIGERADGSTQVLAELIGKGKIDLREPLLRKYAGLNINNNVEYK